MSERWGVASERVDTHPVRGAPIGAVAQARPRDVGIAESGHAIVGRDHGEQERARPDRSTDFPVSMEAAVGERLRVAPIDPKRSAWVGYDVLASGGRAGWLGPGGRAELARMECAEGAWCLKKRRRLGWELLIESADGRHVGWYSGRRGLPGGTISLTDGTQVDLRRLLSGGWKLQTTDARERLADMRRSHRLLMSLTIRSLPAEMPEAHLVILTACAVVMLERMAPPLVDVGGVGLG